MINNNQGNSPTNSKVALDINQPSSNKPASATVRPLEVVTVKVFDRYCSFKSNRPERVQEIASLAEDEIAKVKGQFPGIKNEMDLAAHVTFRLARKLSQCLQEISELSSSLDEAENRVKRMNSNIDQSLGE
jgi:hypothetical protein